MRAMIHLICFTLLFMLTFTVSKSGYAKDCSEKIHKSFKYKKHFQGEFKLVDVKVREVSNKISQYKLYYTCTPTSDSPRCFRDEYTILAHVDKKNCEPVSDHYKPERGNFDFTKLYGKWKRLGCDKTNYAGPILEIQPDLRDGVIRIDGTVQGMYIGGYQGWGAPKLEYVNKGPYKNAGSMCSVFVCGGYVRSLVDGFTTENGFVTEYRSCDGRLCNPVQEWLLHLELESPNRLKTYGYTTGFDYYYPSYEDTCSYERISNE